MTVVSSYILSKLDYCNSLYAGINQSLLNKLQCVQNASARFICKAHTTHWRQVGSMHELLKERHILPVNYRVLYKIALLCYKCLNNTAPSYLCNLISLKTQSSYSLRRNNDCYLLEVLKRPRYQKMENAFSYIGPSVWNSLPWNIRSVNNINTFKTALKTHLFEQAFNLIQ